MSDQAGDHDDAKARTAGIFDRASATYDQVGVEFFSTFGARLVQLSALQPGERVLDVGTGRGAVLFPAAEAVAPGGSVLGIDLAPSMVERCTADIAARGLTDVEVRLGDAEAPDVPEGVFDAVLGGLVIFFLPDPGAALDAYLRALAPDGRLALSTFGAEDQRFGPVFGAVAAFIPPPPGAAESDATTPARAQDGPFASAALFGALLNEHGFGSVDHLEEDYRIVFDGPQQWIDWSWSHGARTLWEMVPEDVRPAAHDAAVEALMAQAEPDGTITHHWSVRYTIARR